SMREPSSITVFSVAAPAGTITHTVRGLATLAPRPARDADAIAPSDANCFTLSALRSLTTQSCPPRMRRRTMLPPMRPNPTIPSCIFIDPPPYPSPHTGEGNAATYDRPRVDRPPT